MLNLPKTREEIRVTFWPNLIGRYKLVKPLIRFGKGEYSTMQSEAPIAPKVSEKERMGFQPRKNLKGNLTDIIL